MRVKVCGSEDVSRILRLRPTEGFHLCDGQQRAARAPEQEETVLQTGKRHTAITVTLPSFRKQHFRSVMPLFDSPFL